MRRMQSPHRRSGPTGKPAPGRTGTGEQTLNTKVAALIDELDVVDLAAEHPVAVDELVIEDLMGQTQMLCAHPDVPPPVRTYRGSAATATIRMTTRKAPPATLARRPLRRRPIYAPSLATMSSGR